MDGANPDEPILKIRELYDFYSVGRELSNESVKDLI